MAVVFLDNQRINETSQQYTTIYSRTSIIRTAIIRNVDYPNGNHTKRQITTLVFSSLKFLVHSLKNTVYSEIVTKPAETARQTAKSLLKEVEILQAAWWYNA